MFRWNKRFELKGKPKFFKQQGDVLDKLLVVQHKKDVDNYFERIL